MKGGKTVGLSTYTGYTYNERAMAVARHASTTTTRAPGTEVTIVWGEEGRGSTKPTVERHKQAELRADRRAGADLGGRARGVPTEVTTMLITKANEADPSWNSLIVS